jgi:hypothetical protein
MIVVGARMGTRLPARRGRTAPLAPWRTQARAAFERGTLRSRCLGGQGAFGRGAAATGPRRDPRPQRVERLPGGFSTPMIWIPAAGDSGWKTTVSR